MRTMVQHDGIAVLGCINLPDVTWVGNNICCINEATRTEGAFGESIIYLEHAILFWTQYSLLSTYAAQISLGGCILERGQCIDRRFYSTLSIISIGWRGEQ
jgi:hypothetical protein